MAHINTLDAGKNAEAEAWWLGIGADARRQHSVALHDLEQTKGPMGLFDYYWHFIHPSSVGWSPPAEKLGAGLHEVSNGRHDKPDTPTTNDDIWTKIRPQESTTMALVPALIAARAAFLVPQALKATGGSAVGGSLASMLGGLFKTGLVLGAVDDAVEFLSGGMIDLFPEDNQSQDKVRDGISDWAYLVSSGEVSDFRFDDMKETSPGEGYMIIPGPQQKGAHDGQPWITSKLYTNKMVKSAVARALTPATRVSSAPRRRKR
jgi:hypothetical protein